LNAADWEHWILECGRIGSTKELGFEPPPEGLSLPNAFTRRLQPARRLLDRNLIEPSNGRLAVSLLHQGKTASRHRSSTSRVATNVERRKSHNI
jgi:hypothetical protein